jgi:hypothetical protein
VSTCSATERISPPSASNRCGKLFCAFRSTTPKGNAGEVTLFVKRCLWKGRPEAVHYRHRAAAGVPTPRLYGALSNDRGEEIIFVERLSRIGCRLDRVVGWQSLLSLMARFNACVVTPDYAPHLHRYEQVGAVDGGLWITGVHASPTPDWSARAAFKGSSLRGGRSAPEPIDGTPAATVHRRSADDR